MATHWSIPVRKMLGLGDLGGLYSIRSQRVEYDSGTKWII